MANKSCQSCADLQNDAPGLIVNGMTNTERTSLANNTGLSPGNSNNDCTDLNNMNDCLIGNMVEEIEAYDVCDWKDYTKNFVDNVWTVFAGVISAICGLWTKTKDLEDGMGNLCTMIDGLIDPPLLRFGTLLNDYGSQHPERRGGTIAKKNGNSVLVPMERSEVSDPAWKGQSIGLYHAVQKVKNCSTGRCQNLEWIAPNLVAYKVHPDVTLEMGDLLWSCSVSQLRTWGFTDDIIESFTIASWTWTDYAIGGLPRGIIWINLSIEGSTMRMTYQGKVGADQLTANRRIQEGTNPAKLYRTSCS